MSDDFTQIPAEFWRHFQNGDGVEVAYAGGNPLIQRRIFPDGTISYIDWTMGRMAVKHPTGVWESYEDVQVNSDDLKRAFPDVDLPKVVH